MRAQRSDATRITRAKKQRPRLEALEDRNLLAIVLNNPLTVQQFFNPLPNALDPSFVYSPLKDSMGNVVTTSVNLQNGTKAQAPLYNVGIYQIPWDIGLGLKNTDGTPIKTTVYGYGPNGDSTQATYPGRTFEVQSGEPIAVQWTNHLPAGTHLLPVDKTLLDPNNIAQALPYYKLSTNAANITEVTFPSGIPTVSHLHGGHTTAAYDGTPDQWSTAVDAPQSQQFGPDFPGNPFVYDNSQQAATIWYHDHAMGVTRLNVYAGLAGFYIVHDKNENALVANHNLPGPGRDIPLAIQDRTFYGPTSVDDPNTPWSEAPGQLFYPTTTAGKLGPATQPLPNPSSPTEFFGDTILVNGKAWPVLDVDPAMYRFRILDGSDSRFYNLKVFDQTTGINQTFYQVGSDQGLLAAPVAMTQLLVAPGERADVVVDFRALAGKTIILTNDAKTPYPKGASVDPRTTGHVMAFRVRNVAPINDVTLPASLNAITPLPAPTPDPNNPTDTHIKQLGLFETFDPYGRLIQKIGAAVPDTNPVVFAPSNFMGPDGKYVNPETVQLMPDPTSPTGMSVIEEWQVYNTTKDVHPMHLHQVAFQLVSRQDFNFKVVDPVTGAFVVTGLTGQPKLAAAYPNEAGWKDTIQMYPGQVTTIRMKFDLPGNYVWHCHILEHEEHDMMHGLVILAAADLSIKKTDNVGGVYSSATNNTTSGTAVPGQTLVYTIVVRNNGPIYVPVVSVKDPFPAAITSDTWMATATGGATGFTANGSGNINDTVNMPVGSTITYTVTANISSTARGNLVNTATVSPNDSNPGNNSSIDTVTLPAAAPAVMTAASTPAATGTGSATAIATPTATASTLADAASPPVPLTTGSTSGQVAMSRLADPIIDPKSVPLDPILRKKLLGY